MNKLPEVSVGTIPISKIQPSKTNPRKTFDEAELDALADSIREHGVLQDILVRPVGKDVGFTPQTGWKCDGFEIIAGERRYRAAKIAGLKSLQCKVQPMADAEVLALQLVENDQRVDVKPSEQAAAYKRLVDAVGLEQAAEQVGRSPSVVRGIVSLARCSEELANAVDAGTVSRSVAELVCRVPSSDSRALATVCVLAGATHPGGLGSESPLTYRETKELITKYFTRELKLAPFSRRSLDLVPEAGSCEECPKRAGNLAKEDPEFASVRADVCTDPECYGEKCEAHRMEQRQKFAKRWSIAELDDVDVESDPFAFDRMTLTTGWTEWDVLVAESELATESWAKGRKPTSATLVRELLDGLLVPRLAFDVKGIPRTVIRTADARKALRKSGLIAKPEKATSAKSETKQAASETKPGDGEAAAYSLYRIVAENMPWHGVEFDCHSGANNEEIAQAALDVILERIDYGWERVPDEEADELPTKSSKVVQTNEPAEQAIPTPVDESNEDDEEVGQPGGEFNPHGLVPPKGEPIGPLGLTVEQCEATTSLAGFNPKNPTVKTLGLNGREWIVTGTCYGGQVYRYWEIQPLYAEKDFLAKYPDIKPRTAQGFLDGLDADTSKHPAGYYGGLVVTVGRGKNSEKRVIGLKGESRRLLWLNPKVDSQPPQPGPIVCRPVGELKLSEIPGITADDYALLVACCLPTLSALEAKCQQHLASKRYAAGSEPSVNSQVYSVLRVYPGIFAEADVVRIGDAILDFLSLKAEPAQVRTSAPPAKKAKRKAVTA